MADGMSRYEFFAFLRVMNWSLISETWYDDTSLGYYNFKVCVRVDGVVYTATSDIVNKFVEDMNSEILDDIERRGRLFLLGKIAVMLKEKNG